MYTHHEKHENGEHVEVNNNYFQNSQKFKIKFLFFEITIRDTIQQGLEVPTQLLKPSCEQTPRLQKNSVYFIKKKEKEKKDEPSSVERERERKNARFKNIIIIIKSTCCGHIK